MICKRSQGKIKNMLPLNSKLPCHQPPEDKGIIIIIQKEIAHKTNTSFLHAINYHN